MGTAAQGPGGPLLALAGSPIERPLRSVLGPGSGSATYPASPVLAISGEWEDGIVLNASPRTNLCTRSQALNTGWTWVNAGATPDTTSAPDGTTTADSVVENTATSVHRATIPGGGTSGSPVVLSAFYSPSGRGVVTTLGSANVYFSTTGTILLGSGATVAGSLNGFYRITHTTTPVSTTATIGLASGTAALYLGDGTSGAALWGVQVEAGGTAGRYIPTAGTVVTETDVVYTASTGRAVLSRALSSGATLIADGIACTQVDTLTWQAQPI